MQYAAMKTNSLHALQRAHCVGANECDDERKQESDRCQKLRHIAVLDNRAEATEPLNARVDCALTAHIVMQKLNVVAKTG